MIVVCFSLKILSGSMRVFSRVAIFVNALFILLSFKRFPSVFLEVF